MTFSVLLFGDMWFNHVIMKFHVTVWMIVTYYCVYRKNTENKGIQKLSTNNGYNKKII